MQQEVTLFAEKLFSIGSLPITNTMITSWIVSAALIGFAHAATRNIKIVPSGIQNFFEVIIEALYNLIEGVAKDRTKLFFPLLATFFFFIILNNWSGLLPGVGSIGFYETHPPEAVSESIQHQAVPAVDEHGAMVAPEAQPTGEHATAEPVFVPIFRAATSDLNTTLALALISVLATQYFGIRKLGLLGYVTHYFHSPLKGGIAVVGLGLLIGMFIGFLEIVSEIVKVVSLSFRLFGNVYAGEAVLQTVSGIAKYFAPIPFLLLEVIVGFVQASVFMMLTLVFLAIITEGHEEAH